MTLTLRPLTVADSPTLWNMLYHALYVPPGQQPFARDILLVPEIARYARDWGRPGDVGVVAQAGDEAIGAAWLRLWPAGDRGYGFVDETTPEVSIAVLPPYRGRGVGSQLLTWLLQEARGRFTGVSLSLHRDNPAVALYRRFGFEVLCEDGDSLAMIVRWSQRQSG